MYVCSNFKKDYKFKRKKREYMEEFEERKRAGK